LGNGTRRRKFCGRFGDRAEDANALFALGEIYLSQKKDGEAEKVLLQGLQIEDRSFQHI